MNLRGRCQQILTVLRERGPQSIRKLAQATGLPKSSVDRHCKGLRERARQVPEAELWEHEQGAQWLRVLVLAVLFVFGLKGGVGVRADFRVFSSDSGLSVTWRSRRVP